MTQIPNLTTPPLTPETVHDLETARHAYRKIAKAIRAARLDGWTVAAFGGLTFFFGLGDWSSMLVGMIFIVLGWVELRGADRLKQFDPAAINVLALNQISLGVIMIIYCLWQIWEEMHGHGFSATLAEAIPSGEDLGVGDVVGTTHQLTIDMYLLLILISFLGMGWLSFYHYTRRKYLNQYLQQTPPWIIAMQKTGVRI